jgi:HSP20 family protein
MSLIRWDPLRELNKMMGARWDLPSSTTGWNPAVDIFETENEVVIKAELPGMEAKDIDIRLENNVLTLKGERHFSAETKEENYHRVEREYGTFSRSFSLPSAVKEDKIKADYKDGMLKVTLPKKEEVKPKAIKIEAA